MNGADQLVLFGERYHLVERALIAFVIISLGIDAIRRRGERGFWRDYSIPVATLLLLALLAVPLLPRGVHFPGKPAAMALLTERLTSVTAVFACCLLGAMRPRRWHLAARSAIAAVFFAFLYQDTAIAESHGSSGGRAGSHACRPTSACWLQSCRRRSRA